MIIFKLRDVLDDLNRHRGESERKYSMYRLHKDSEIALSTIFRLAKGKPMTAIYAETLERLMVALNAARQPRSPEYTFNDLFEIVTDEEYARRSKPRRRAR